MAAPDTIARIIDEQWPFIEQYCNTFQLRIFDAIRRCRTPSLGGHLYRCDTCQKLHYRYNSCRNRHCSRCQNTQKEQWIEQRQQQFINCHYYHLVFTLPHQLNELCLAYPRQLYKLLMATAWQTIDAFGWNHKFLGAQTGATMVLHTWGSNLSFHPHRLSRTAGRDPLHRARRRGNNQRKMEKCQRQRQIPIPCHSHERKIQRPVYRSAQSIFRHSRIG